MPLREAEFGLAVQSATIPHWLQEPFHSGTAEGRSNPKKDGKSDQGGKAS